MGSAHDVDVMMIGHFAVDRNIVDGSAVTESGGGVYFGGMVARRLGMRVAVVTRLHPDDFSRLREMQETGVRVFATAAPETSGIANSYDSADMERRICKPLGFAGPFEAKNIPDLTARIYAVVPIMAGEVDLDLLRLLADRGPVAIDVQGFVRVREGADLVFRQWADVEEGLSHVTYLKVDRAEAELLTGMADLPSAARELAGYGPREIVITESSGVTVLAEGRIHQAPFASRSLDGRTGRGDTCFAAYLATRLSSSPQDAARWAAAITTLKQEEPGPWRGHIAAAEALVRRVEDAAIPGS